MKKTIRLLLLCLGITASAQDDSRIITGPGPEARITNNSDIWFTNLAPVHWRATEKKHPRIEILIFAALGSMAGMVLANYLLSRQSAPPNASQGKEG